MSTAGRIRFEVAVKGFPKDGAQDSLYGVLADCKEPDGIWKGYVACLPGDGDRPWDSLCVRAARPVDHASTGRSVVTRPQHTLDTSIPQAPFASEFCSRWKKKRSTMPSALWTFRTSPTGQCAACCVGTGVVWSLPTQWVALADTCPLQAAGGQPRRICAAPERRRDGGVDCRFWQDCGLRGERVSRASHRPRGGQQECVSGLSSWMWLSAVSIPACVAGIALTPCVFWRLCQSRGGPHPTFLAFQGRGSVPCLCQLPQEL